ncbi:hypothetical protein SBADM41S_03695 [Streptomyces badius]
MIAWPILVITRPDVLPLHHCCLLVARHSVALSVRR